LPVLLLIAGPNGSGKSTLVASAAGQSVLKQLGLNPADMLNADEQAAMLAGHGPVTPDISLAAAIDIDTALDRAIGEGRPVAVETVLSSDKYVRRVDAASAKGYAVVMVYVCVADEDLNVARVRSRVMDGGHDVPEDRIRGRRQRSIDMLDHFIPKLDALYVFDNSFTEGGPVLIARKLSADTPVEILVEGAIADLERILRRHVA
jgi:predicted ABC-type ATPase